MSFRSVTGASPVLLGMQLLLGPTMIPASYLLGTSPAIFISSRGEGRAVLSPIVDFQELSSQPSLPLSPSHRWLASAPSNHRNTATTVSPRTTPPLLSSTLGMTSCLSFLNIPTVLHAFPILSCYAELKSPGNRSSEISLVPTDPCEGMKAARLGPMSRLSQAPRSSG